MGTITDPANAKVSVIIKEKESIIQSFFKDLVTFIVIGFCVYISKDSTWWTFVTGGMFITFAVIKMGGIINKSVNVFDDKESAIEYINDKFNQ